MVIQRLQTVYLLIAAILIALLCFIVPVAIETHEGLTTTYYVKDFTPALIINMIITGLLIACVFLYKNLRLQMRVTLLIIALIAVAFGVFGYILMAKLPEGAEIAWLWSAIIFFATVLFAGLAYRRMKSDYNLLRSYDRLR